MESSTHRERRLIFAQLTIEERYRNDEAGLDEIISDKIVTFPNSTANRQSNHKVRVICLRVNPHTTRGKFRGGSSGVVSDGVLRIATSFSSSLFKPTIRWRYRCAVDKTITPG